VLQGRTREILQRFVTGVRGGIENSRKDRCSNSRIKSIRCHGGYLLSSVRSVGLEAGSSPPHHWQLARDDASRAGMPGRRYQVVSWLVLIGLLIPAWEAQISVAGAKFTAGRLAVAILFIPAIIVLARRGRHIVACDIFALLTAAWIPLAASVTSGPGSFSSASAESMEFFFSYVVGRAFFFQPAALDTFIRVLRTLTIVVVIIAIAESISGRWIAHELASSLFGTTPLSAVFRGNTIRATSSLDHPILFGVFCGVVSAILLLWEQGALRRAFFSGICLIGCILSQSSAALMCFVLVLAAFFYDRMMRGTPARWTIFWAVVGAGISAVFVLSQHPIGWLISHLTLDPETGYYRILIWNAALDRISQSPLTGYALDLFNENILDSTVDCVWLVAALRFGIPASAFLFLTNLAAIWPNGKPRATASRNFDERMNLAFTIVLLMFMFSGITVHFWNYMWIFWGLCIGIKASLRERTLA
jgi:hypothetical protein